MAANSNEDVILQHAQSKSENDDDNDDGDADKAEQSDTEAAELESEVQSTNLLVKGLRPVDSKGRLRQRYSFHGLATVGGLVFAGVQKGSDSRSFLVVFHCASGAMHSLLPSHGDFTEVVSSVTAVPGSKRLYVRDRAFGVRALNAAAVAETLEAGTALPRKLRFDMPFLTLKGTSEAIHAETVCPLQQYLIVTTPQRNETALFNTEAGDFAALYKGHSKHPTCSASFKLSWGETAERFVVTGGRDRRVMLFEFATQKRIRTFTGHHHSILFVGLVCDVIVSASMESLRFFEPRSKAACAFVRYPSSQSVEITSVIIARSRVFVGLSSGEIHVFTDKGRRVAILRCIEPADPKSPRAGTRSPAVKALAVTEDEQFLIASIPLAITLFVWDISSAEEWHDDKCRLFFAPSTLSNQEEHKKCLIQ
ncbi:MAG: hypothetical protein Q8P67_10450 [archaeon]|nr:hypothetical protein [archaeon]